MGNADTKLHFRKAVIQLTTKTQPVDVADDVSKSMGVQAELHLFWMFNLLGSKKWSKKTFDPQIHNYSNYIIVFRAAGTYGDLGTSANHLWQIA